MDYIELAVPELLRMPHPELPTLVYEHLKLALEGRHSGLATLALGIRRLETGASRTRL